MTYQLTQEEHQLLNTPIAVLIQNNLVLQALAVKDKIGNYNLEQKRIAREAEDKVNFEDKLKNVFIHGAN